MIIVLLATPELQPEAVAHMSHALLKRLGVGTSLCSVAKVLGREKTRYK